MPPLLPAIERSAGEVFRAIDGLSWLANAPDLPAERYAALIAGGAAWVAVDDDRRIGGFLCGEVFDDELHLGVLVDIILCPSYSGELLDEQLCSRIGIIEIKDAIG